MKRNQNNTEKAPTRAQMRSTISRRWLMFIPYGWLIAFFLIPFLIIVKISLSKSAFSIPPIEPLIQRTEDFVLQIQINFGTYIQLFTENMYASAFIGSLSMALSSTFFCLLIGYAMALAIVQAPAHRRPTLLFFVLLPFWTSFLVRVYAWMGFLGREGVLNTWLLNFGVIDQPLPLLYNNISVLIGVVYCYLPFMILPIYTTLDKIDKVYLEAAYDLGCRPLKAFWTIIFPLSWPGIVSGCILVFVPVIGEFVIPELLGASDTLMIGRMLWLEFFNNRDWPVACALAVSMLLLFVIPIMIFQRYQLKKG